MSTRPLLLLVATGLRAYREYLLRAIAAEYRVHLFHTAEPTWEREHLDGFTVLPNTWDGPAMVAAALELAERGPIDGVLSWDEGRIHAASFVAGALGLRNGDPAVIWRLRDKGQTRAALAGRVRQPRSVPVRTVGQAREAARRIGYPVILKPRGYGASVGVVRVTHDDDLARWYAFTSGTTLPDPVVFDSDHPVLVEECVTGEEISVDSVVVDGEVTPLYVARKVVGYPPHAEEIGHYVDAADPLLTDPALTDALRRTHAALGFRDGWTHTEFMLTDDGPSLIEVNGRLGGDLIPYLGMLATGTDPGLAAAAVACGRPPDVTPTRRRVSGVRFFYADEDDTTIGSVHFTGPPQPQIDLAVAVAQPGAVVSPPPKGSVWSRIAFVTAVGDSVDECRQVLDTAAAGLRVTVAVP